MRLRNKRSLLYASWILCLFGPYTAGGSPNRTTFDSALSTFPDLVALNRIKVTSPGDYVGMSMPHLHKLTVSLSRFSLLDNPKAQALIPY